MAVNVQKFLEGIKKKYDGAIQDVKTAAYVKRLFINSPSLNFIFGGGFGLGRIYEFYGPESGGKSTLATFIGGEVQKLYEERPIVVYVDFEYSFDESFANKLGLATDPDHFILLRPLAGEDAFEILKELIINLPIGLVIIDSIATTSSRAQVQDANKAYGGAAIVYSNGLRSVNPYLFRYKTGMVMINQERANMDAMSPVKQTTPGGYAPKYYSSWRGRVTRIEWITQKGVEVGIKTKVRNTKNKIGIPKREAVLTLMFDTGFNSDQEYMDFIIELGLVTKGGAWLSNPDWGMKVCGKDAMLEFLRSKPELFNQVKNTVNTMMSSVTEIDKQFEDNELDSEDEQEELDVTSLASAALESK